MTAVVFDIGGVLIHWDPHLAWIEELGSREAVAAFLARVDFPARNLRGDSGESFADLAAEIADPEDRERLAAYVSHFARTVPEKVTGTWDILHRLQDRGTPIHAITNWSAETWPAGVSAHPELGEVFGVTIVSGREKILKPRPEIFAMLCDRAGLAPEECLFIDDSPKNVDGAKAAGWDAIHFTGAGALETELSERGLL